MTALPPTQEALRRPASMSSAETARWHRWRELRPLTSCPDESAALRARKLNPKLLHELVRVRAPGYLAIRLYTLSGELARVGVTTPELVDVDGWSDDLVLACPRGRRLLLGDFRIEDEPSVIIQGSLHTFLALAEWSPCASIAARAVTPALIDAIPPGWTTVIGNTTKWRLTA